MENTTLGPGAREGEHVFGVARILASFNDTFVCVHFHRVGLLGPGGGRPPRTARRGTRTRTLRAVLRRWRECRGRHGRGGAASTLGAGRGFRVGVGSAALRLRASPTVADAPVSCACSQAHH